jgi:hypothetical protein
LASIVSSVAAAMLAAPPGSAQLSAAAQGESARAALTWEHPDATAARQRIDDLAGELTPWGQIDYSARLRPLLRYQEYPEDGDAGDLTARLGVSAALTFGDRPATHARALQRLERARHDHFVLVSRGVRDALLAHAELLLAREGVARALREMADADAAVDALEESVSEGDTASLREARLEQRIAALGLRRARQDLADAADAATAYGLASSPRYEPIRFVLSDTAPHDPALATAPAGTNAVPDPRASHEYRMLELALLEAEAELSQARAQPLDDLRLRAAYRTREAEIDLEGGMVNGRPGLGFGFSSPGGRERWQVEVSAELVLDENWHELPGLEVAVEGARQELEAWPAAFLADIARSRAAAELAEEALALAEEDTALAEEALAALRSGMAELEREGGDQRTLERSTQALATAERELSASRLRLYRAWIAYVRAVAGWLESTGGSWAVRAGD